MLKAFKKKISFGSWQPFKFRSEDKRLMGNFMVCVCVCGVGFIYTK